jgi:integrative and conjugative element protein (TIGR02256 family)
LAQCLAIKSETNTINFCPVSLMARKHLVVELPPYYKRVYITNSAVHTLKAESLAKPGFETGGVLVGFTDTTLHAVVVVAASGPGAHAEHGPTTFSRERAFCQSFLDYYAQSTNEIVDFVGEWHKHPEPNPKPSRVDIQTYRRLAADPQCHCELPLVLIVGTRTVSKSPLHEEFVQTNAYIFRRDGFVSRPVRQLPDDAYSDLIFPQQGES